jgi:hypothetical protein
MGIRRCLPVIVCGSAGDKDRLLSVLGELLDAAYSLINLPELRGSRTNTYRLKQR